MLTLVAKKLEVVIHPDDTIVDFSCGSNEFLPIVKEVCRKAGKAVKGKAFDIITPCISEDFQQISWFDVRPGKSPLIPNYCNAAAIVDVKALSNKSLSDC